MQDSNFQKILSFFKSTYLITIQNSAVNYDLQLPSWFTRTKSNQQFHWPDQILARLLQLMTLVTSKLLHLFHLPLSPLHLLHHHLTQQFYLPLFMEGLLRSTSQEEFLAFLPFLHSVHFLNKIHVLDHLLCHLRKRWFAPYLAYQCWHRHKALDHSKVLDFYLNHFFLQHFA